MANNLRDLPVSISSLESINIDLDLHMILGPKSLALSVILGLQILRQVIRWEVELAIEDI